MNKGKNVNGNDIEVAEKTAEETIKKSVKVSEKAEMKTKKASIKNAEVTEKKKPQKAKAVDKVADKKVKIVDEVADKKVKVVNEVDDKKEKEVNEAVTKKVKESNNKETFDNALEKTKKISEAIELYSKVKEAVSKNEVDNNYLNYVENTLEDKLFCDAKTDKINSKVLLEVVCPSLTSIEKFDAQKLEIESIGSHFEEDENYIDKICTYEDKFVCMFGINEQEQEKAIKYEPRKFSRIDMLQAVCEKFDEGKVVQIEQYDEYYVVEDEESLKVFSERKVTALVKVEETIFDKLKNKLTSLFSNNIFAKKRYLPNVELIYDNNQNRFKDFKTTSKVDAKKRMKVLLMRERKVTRNVNI